MDNNRYSEVIKGNVPSKSNSYRIGVANGRHTLIKTDALRKYEKLFYIQCRNRNAMISGYFGLRVKVFYASQRLDLDNSLKIILDCLQSARVITNDNRCVHIEADKYLDKENPRIELELWELA